ncbi:hypothetical protein ABZS66_43705 [Dactylosporangium sp. NPDC005572]|uniref:hypothetical protein n=1 Tax=Dactylosporangium sp. NPDC005572 TaxID=3156889 RepID=UPI0033ABC01C
MMQLGHLNTHQVHQVARFYAAAAAASQGHQVEVVGARTRLLVDGRTVQVLSRRQAGSPWQANVNAPTVDGAHAVIFVDLTGDAPDYFVAPASWVEHDVRTHHAAWLASVGGTRPRNPTSDHTAIPVERIQQWQQRWDVLANEQAD